MDQWRIELYYHTEKFSPSLQLLPLSSIKVDQWGLIRDGVVWNPVRPSSEELDRRSDLWLWASCTIWLKQFTVFTAPTKKFQVTFPIRDKPELLSREKTGIVHSARNGKSDVAFDCDAVVAQNEFACRWLFIYLYTKCWSSFTGQTTSCFWILSKIQRQKKMLRHFCYGVLWAVRKQICTPLHIWILSRFDSSLQPVALGPWCV